MAEKGMLTPEEVVERLNRSLEKELVRLDVTLPTSPRSVWGDPSSLQTVNGAHRKASGGGTVTIDRKRAGSTPEKGNNSLLRKLENSKLHALEALSSVLFEDGKDDTRINFADNSRTSAREGNGQEEKNSTSQPLLEDRVRSKAAYLVEEERNRLLQELHAELDLERKNVNSRKAAISEEAYRAARREQSSALNKQEKDLRTLLARRELKDLKDATYRQLSVAHAQQKEATLMRLKSSLGRGTGYSVRGLKGELWEQAQEKRTSALRNGEVAFGHSCQLLRQQQKHSTQVKKNAMAKEAHVAQKVALVALRKNEAEVTKAEMSRVLHDLERERAEARADLKIELQREAERSVNLAVDACTFVHKGAQQKASLVASYVLREALQASAANEATHTNLALEREKRCAEDQRSSLVAAVEKAFLSGSLRKLAEGSPLSQLPPRPSSKSKSCKPDEEEDATHTVTPETGNIPTSNLHAKNAASAAKAVYIVRYLEGAARAAEQMYAKQAGNLVRLRAEAALRGGHEAIILTRKKEGIREASILPEEETGAIRSKGETERKWQRERAENVVSCGNCSFLFKANERLLQEATSRGLLR